MKGNRLIFYILGTVIVFCGIALAFFLNDSPINTIPAEQTGHRSTISVPNTENVLHDSVIGLSLKLPSTITMNAQANPDGLTDDELQGIYSDYEDNSPIKQAELIAALSDESNKVHILIKRSVHLLDNNLCMNSYPLLDYSKLNEQGEPEMQHLMIDGYPFVYVSGSDNDMQKNRQADIYRGMINGYCLLIDIYATTPYPNTAEYDDKAKYQAFWDNFEDQIAQANQLVKQLTFQAN